ncbi:cache domain-containing sensor histidine kinase [Paenibacillus soyae]|uniref:Histidine kinase n=1 Tax=Paenibacillus soyae TaxID=2969249 RepID=A0A9X2MPT4_9BACL|nr:sensor histidine kinase [Paenibacillus soyae]MCR2804611.1 histidine kinase [Paenibacillus soyae]
MKRLFRSTYYSKIQVSFILLILLPIVTVTIISYTVNRNASMDNIALSNKSILQLMEQDIEETVSDLAYASLIFVENDLLKPYYKHYAELDGISNFQDYEIYSGIESLLNLVSFKASPNHIHLFIANEKGLIISTPGFFARGKSIDELEDHWKQIQAKDNLANSSHFQWLGAVSSESYPEKFFYGTRVIRDTGTGRVLAVLNIGISENYFKELFDPIKTGKFALFNSDGELFAGSPDVSLSAPGDKGTIIRSSASIPIVDWDLVFETPKADVVGQLTRTFYISGIIIAVSMVLFLLLSMLLARKLHKPIHKLQRIAVQFGGGNRSMRFQVSGEDEINDLGRTLNDMLDQIEELIANMAREQDEKRRMELQTLANQIRPHFLLNTLNAMKISLIMGGDQVHGEKINSLMSLLRNYLKMDEPSFLHEEVEVLRHYVSLMEMRSDMRIRFEASFSEEAGMCRIPKLLLQPIVENAIVHGFLERDDHSAIVLRAEIQQGDLVIAVADNGMGMDEAAIAEMNAKLQAEGAAEHRDPDHIGVRNILQRMKLVYGEAAALRLERNEEGGLTVCLHIPVMERSLPAGGEHDV